MEDTRLTVHCSFPKLKEMIDAKQKILELAKEIGLIEVNNENVEELLASNSKEFMSKEFI